MKIASERSTPPSSFESHGRGEHSGRTRAIVLAGLTERELHAFMAAYKTLGFSRPLWASLTPHSEGWKVRALLAELKEEAAELAARRPAGGS